MEEQTATGASLSAPSSSSTSHSYEHLLNQLTGLQAELQRVTIALQTTSQEKEQFRASYETTRTELFRTKSKYESARKEALDALEAKIEGERNTEMHVQKWRSAYDEILKSYEELQAKYAPQDLELLRIQVANELEGPHQQALADLRQEAEAHEQAEAEMKRRLAALQATKDQQTIEFESELKILREERLKEREEHQKERDAIQNKLEQQVAPKDDEIRLLSRSLYEVRAELAATKEELAGIRTREKAAEAAKARAIIEQLEDVTKLQAAIADARAVAASATRRAAAAEERQAEQKGLLQQSREKVTQLENEVEHLRNTIVMKEQTHSEAFSRLHEESQREKHILEVKLSETTLELQTEAARATRSAEIAKEAVEGANQRQARLEALEEEIRRQNRVSVQQLQEEVEALETQVASLENQAAVADEESKVSLQRLRREMENARAEATRAMREKETAFGKLTAAEELLRRTRTANADLKREKDEAKLKASNVEMALQASEDRERDVDQRLQELNHRYNSLETELQTLTQQQEERRLAHASALKDLQSRSADELRRSLEHERTSAEAQLKSLSESLQRERRRSAAYKEKAMEAHRYLVRAKSMIAASQRSVVAGELDVLA
mmetsp:Transcript_17330/g.66041  ORF Transcript_17330/g.66041 Transcript_17330/m.66041 type:complete len:617 (-) Transcript_17330:20-1870(-)